MDNQLAVSLSHLLEINKVDIKQLSEAINVSENRLNDIKEDLISSPTLTIVTKIANYFDVTIDYLIYGMPMVKDINNNGINWKPIEELTEQSDINVIVCNLTEKSFPKSVAINIGNDGEKHNKSYLVNNEFIITNDDIVDYLNANNFTHYALLTPPESNL